MLTSRIIHGTQKSFRNLSATRGVSSLRVLQSETFNPHFNLATEEHIFETMKPDAHVLFLWRNEPTIVLGRHQNAWSECKVSEIEKDGVHIARRKSGGGAVYQDLGNTCWTFMSPVTDYSTDRNTEIVTTALKDFGVEAEASGRNDIVVGDKKVSGSAFRRSGDRAFHHGTLLLNVEMSRLGNYLTPHTAKLKSKGIKSVAARVANLCDLAPGIAHDGVSDALVRAFAAAYNKPVPDVETLRMSDLQAIPEINAPFQQLSSWEWRLGRSPVFSHSVPANKFAWGLTEVHLDVAKGAVTDARVFSDALDVSLPDRAKDLLVGVRYTPSDVRAAFAGQGAELEELGEWVAEQVTA